MSDIIETHVEPTTPRWVGLAVGVLGGVSLIGLLLGWSAYSHTNSLEQTTQAALKQQNDTLMQRVTKDEDQNQQLQSDLKVVTDKLNVTQEDLQKARQQSRIAAANYGKKISGLESNVNTVNTTLAT